MNTLTLRKNERDAWLNIIQPAELDSHMAAIGQAETNAAIVQEFFARFPLEDDARLLIHGCGSCQMLEYMNLSELGKADVTFADFSPAMLEEGTKRLAAVSDVKYTVVVDDIEESALKGQCDVVLLVLVLLHVNWRKSLENMMHLSPSRFYIIEQTQTAGASTITSQGQLLPSIQRYGEVAEMELVSQEELTLFMEAGSYTRRWITTHPVSGEKAMVGFVFEKNL